MIKNVVIFADGAFNPPHIAHIEMFLMGKKCMGKHGFNVVKGVMNPSADSYKKSGMISFEHRNEMCKLLVSKKEYNWIDVENFDDSNRVEVLKQCHEKTAKNMVKLKLCKFWTFEELKTILENYGMIIEVNSNRPGKDADPIQILDALNLPIKNVFTVSSTDEISSTAIREAFKNKNYDSLKEIMDENVIDYIVSHHFYE
uniref:Cytidyltransferase-like domain-containing protein n=1 Tax=Panagrolaimus sp. ES5 TaxID=591445 RepID=A0AC34FAL5_9BILA